MNQPETLVASLHASHPILPMPLEPLRCPRSALHSLRHPFNPAMASAGIPQEICQKLTGHAIADRRGGARARHQPSVRATGAETPASPGDGSQLTPPSRRRTSYRSLRCWGNSTPKSCACRRSKSRLPYGGSLMMRCRDIRCKSSARLRDAGGGHPIPPSSGRLVHAGVRQGTSHATEGIRPRGVPLRRPLPRATGSGCRRGPGGGREDRQGDQ